MSRIAEDSHSLGEMVCAIGSSGVYGHKIVQGRLGCPGQRLGDGEHWPDQRSRLDVIVVATLWSDLVRLASQPSVSMQ